MKKKQRPAARWLAAALAALLAACAPLGRQPTVESEVIEPQADGAATAIDKVDDPDYEARIVTDFTGGSARMPDEDRTAPVGGGLSPDETVRRSAALLRAAGAALGGEWTLWLYPEELAGPVGSAPMYFVQQTQGSHKWELWIDTEGAVQNLFDAGCMTEETYSALTARDGAEYAAWAAEQNAWVRQEADAWLAAFLDEAGLPGATVTQAAFEGELIPPDAAARDEAVSRTGRYVQQNRLEYTVQDAQGVMWYASVDPLQRRLIILIREAELGENLRFDSKGKLQGEGITPLYRAYQEGRRRAWATWNIKRNEWRDDGNGQ